MINRLKQLKNLSIPQKLIRAMIIKLCQDKIKLGQGSRMTSASAGAQRAAKTSSREYFLRT